MFRGVLSAAEGWSTASMVMRMAAALIVGVVVGIDRGMKRRGAGVKTHVLVCLGSAVVMMTGEYLHLKYPGHADISRMGAQVISGVGFLGVGTIIVTGRNQIRGLTTAAGLWACACLGLAIGIGYVEGALVAFGMVLITLKLLTRLDVWVHKYAKVFDLYLEFPNNKCVSQFVQELHRRVASFELGKSKIKGEGPNAIICVEVQDRNKKEKVLADIRSLPYITYVEEL